MPVVKFIKPRFITPTVKHHTSTDHHHPHQICSYSKSTWSSFIERNQLGFSIPHLSKKIIHVLKLNSKALSTCNTVSHHRLRLRQSNLVLYHYCKQRITVTISQYWAARTSLYVSLCLMSCVTWKRKSSVTLPTQFPRPTDISAGRDHTTTL